MNNSRSATVHVGSHGDYEWLVTRASLDDLLRVCPEVVVGKYIAITSFDSGPLVLNEEETAEGWVSLNDIAYSPEIKNVAKLPRDLYDEWYIFEGPAEMERLNVSKAAGSDALFIEGKVHVFVNYGGFGLHGPEFEHELEWFWMQFDGIRPQTYVADGNFLTVVTTDKLRLAKLRSALRKDASGPEGPPGED